MARVIIDPHMFSELWFSKILNELIKAPAVRFVYGGLPKEILEVACVRAALQFFKQISAIKKLDMADACAIERFHTKLIEDPVWQRNHRVCDDSHYFALVRAVPTPFVFSKDHRMAHCRDCLSGRVTSEYLRFSVIGSERTYQDERDRVLT